MLYVKINGKIKRYYLNNEYEIKRGDKNEIYSK